MNPFYVPACSRPCVAIVINGDRTSPCLQAEVARTAQRPPSFRGRAALLLSTVAEVHAALGEGGRSPSGTVHFFSIEPKVILNYRNRFSVKIHYRMLANGPSPAAAGSYGSRTCAGFMRGTLCPEELQVAANEVCVVFGAGLPPFPVRSVVG
jgi:hypothetical protein